MPRLFYVGPRQKRFHFGFPFPGQQSPLSLAIPKGKATISKKTLNPYFSCGFPKFFLSVFHILLLRRNLLKEMVRLC